MTHPTDGTSPSLPPKNASRPTERSDETILVSRQDLASLAWNADIDNLASCLGTQGLIDTLGRIKSELGALLEKAPKGQSTQLAPTADEPLMAFTVTHHQSGHECTSVVIAKTKWEASLAVQGQVMDVSEGEELISRKVLTHSGWNLSSWTPSFREPSPQWTEYLKSHSLNTGVEDTP